MPPVRPPGKGEVEGEGLQGVTTGVAGDVGRVLGGTLRVRKTPECDSWWDGHILGLEVGGECRDCSCLAGHLTSQGMHRGREVTCRHVQGCSLEAR